MAEVRNVWLGADFIVSALGASTEECLAAVEAGRSGLAAERPVGRIDAEKERRLTGSLREEGFTRLESLMIAAVQDVIRRSGIDPAAAELFVATAKGNIDLLDGSLSDERCFIWSLAERVACRTGIVAPPAAVSNACISGVSALVAAARAIERGECDDAIVVGGDLLTDFVTSGFEAFRSVSAKPCRPYDAARDGLSIGEACGAVLLTARREAAGDRPVRLAGGATSADANHISAPSRTGDGLAFAIEAAMREAGVAASDISTVNAHGTATAYNDEMESKALHIAGLDRVPMNSLKPYFGHTLGASGVIETVVVAEELRRGVVYGTLGYENCGVPYPLDVASRHRRGGLRCAVKTASGFGGCNAAAVLIRDEGGARKDATSAEWRESAEVRIEPDGRPFAEMIRAGFKALEAPDMKFYKMDDLSKLGYVASCRLLGGSRLAERYAPERIAVVLGNSSASLDTDLRHLADLSKGEVSPAVFVYTLPNIVAGQIQIRHGLKGETAFFIERDGAERAERYARQLIGQGRADAVVTGRCELLGERFEARLKLLERK